MNLIVDFIDISDISQILNIDKIAFNEYEQLDYLQCIEFYKKNKFQFLSAKDQEGNVLGYISFWHIYKDVFDRVVNGEIFETEISPKDIVPFGDEKEIYCHLGGFVVLNQNKRVAIAIINKMLKYFRFLKENRIVMKKISTIPVSSIGLQLSQKLGFEKVGAVKVKNEEIFEDIYVLDFEKNSYSNLVNKIKEIFIENDKFL